MPDIETTAFPRRHGHAMLPASMIRLPRHVMILRLFAFLLALLATLSVSNAFAAAGDKQQQAAIGFETREGFVARLNFPQRSAPLRRDLSILEESCSVDDDGGPHHRTMVRVVSTAPTMALVAATGRTRSFGIVRTHPVCAAPPTGPPFG